MGIVTIEAKTSLECKGEFLSPNAEGGNKQGQGRIYLFHYLFNTNEVQLPHPSQFYV